MNRLTQPRTLVAATFIVVAGLAALHIFRSGRPAEAMLAETLQCGQWSVLRTAEVLILQDSV